MRRRATLGDERSGVAETNTGIVKLGVTQRLENSMITWGSGNPSPAPERVKEVEQKFGISFPSGYLGVVAEHDNACPTPRCFDIPDREAVFEHLVSFWKKGEHTCEQGIDEMWDQLSVWLPRYVFPFGLDPFGNCLCFDYRTADDSQPSQHPAVVFWDRDQASKENPDQALTFVASSFGELLHVLHD